MVTVNLGRLVDVIASVLVRITRLVGAHVCIATVNLNIFLPTVNLIIFLRTVNLNTF